MEALRVPAPAWRITLQGHDVTRPLARYITQIAYTDHVSGKADEVELTLEDSDGRWKGEWLPDQGDRLSLEIGYAGEALMPCGDFEVDDLEFSTGPDVLRLRALSAGITPALRTANSAAYEDVSLRAVAQAVANRNGLKLIGEIADVVFQRVTQDEETDLAFLKRMAEAHGHVAKVVGDTLVFHDRRILEAGPSVFTIQRGDGPGALIAYSLRAKTHKVAKGAKVGYWGPDKKGEVKFFAADGSAKTGDTIKLDQRVENEQQAESLAQAAIGKSRRSKLEGDIELVGEPRLVAGATVALAGEGKLDGKYLNKKSRHDWSRSDGYVTSLEVHRV